MVTSKNNILGCRLSPFCHASIKCATDCAKTLQSDCFRPHFEDIGLRFPGFGRSYPTQSPFSMKKHNAPHCKSNS
jgi:hypothetical protein